MGAAREFRALSLDLWFTTIYFTPEQESRWHDARVRFLGDALRPADGRERDPSEISRGIRAVNALHHARGLDPVSLRPAEQLAEYAAYLGSELTRPTDELAERFSSVGLQEAPPLTNPEAVTIVRELTARGVPVVVVTNTARSEATWRRYFRDRTDLPIEHVVASCDLGSAKPDPKVFLEASRRLGLDPGQILHAGDRADLDVVGARRAGFGAVLYTGLWHLYPPGLYAGEDARGMAVPGVVPVSRLEDLLSAYRFG